MNKKDIFLGIKTNPKNNQPKPKKIDNTKYDYIITSDLKELSKHQDYLIIKKL